jgi:hypothetical protein
LKAASTPLPGSLRLAVVGDRPVVNGVYLNGQGPYRFLIDTGAKRNQVDFELARKLGLNPTFRVQMTTAAGTTTSVRAGRLAELTLGPAHAANQEFLFIRLHAVCTLSKDIQGVLGQQFLAHFDYLLDLGGKILSINAPVPPGDHIPAELIDGRMAIVTSQGRLVFDSGSNTLILFHTGSSSNATTSMRTALGFTSVHAGGRVRVRVADREFEAAHSVILPRPAAKEDGLLPACVFDSIYVSNSGRYIVTDPVTR